MGLFKQLSRHIGAKSRQVAKSRLQQVLVRDRLALSPIELDRLKHDLITVISSYAEVDQAGVEIALKGQGRHNHLVAQIPIVTLLQR